MSTTITNSMSSLASNQNRISTTSTQNNTIEQKQDIKNLSKTNDTVTISAEAKKALANEHTHGGGSGTEPANASVPRGDDITTMGGGSGTEPRNN